MVIATTASRVNADSQIKKCIDASDEGLDLRKQGKLLDARRTLAVCADAACGAEIKDTCEKRIAAINAAIPTVAFQAMDGTGNDLTYVSVSMDGKPLLERLQGNAVSLDPGPHTFHFESEGMDPVDKTLVLVEGVKGRNELVTFRPTARPSSRPAIRPAAPSAAQSATQPAAPTGPQPATLVVAAGAEATVSIDGKVAGTGEYRDQIEAGTHVVRVEERGKVAYRAEIDLREGETRTLEVALQNQSGGVGVWPWIAAAAVLTAGAAVGGYFLFKPSNTTEPVPQGKLGGVQFAGFAWGAR